MATTPISDQINPHFCSDFFSYHRRKTRVVNIGNVPLGGDHPIRVQSMTTVDTMDTAGSIAQCIRMIESGCEYVRITAPSLNEAKNLAAIKNGLRAKGYQTPLVADIHFTPNAAEEAARIVEKVRINPGNYADKKKFNIIDYTDDSYQEELDRIRERFTPLVKICKEHGTAMRIGTNHGSLSDRIMSRYGDTPHGMVESALEFLRICEDNAFYDIVISMKSSNTQTMVQAYRLLVKRLEIEGLQPYPLHLGVTEAGEGDDGRIKSAVGIGTLLADGLGDTVRVSLTEDPEFEAPVAQALIDRYTHKELFKTIQKVDIGNYTPYRFTTRKTHEVLNFGGGNVPRVIADFSNYDITDFKDLKPVGHYYLPELDKFKMGDQGVDWLYFGDKKVPFMLPNGLKAIQNFKTWTKHIKENEADKEHIFPILGIQEFMGESLSLLSNDNVFFLEISVEKLNEQLLKQIKIYDQCILICSTSNNHVYPAFRSVFFKLAEYNLNNPVILSRSFDESQGINDMQLTAATDFGGLLLDGYGNGLLMSAKSEDHQSPKKQWLKDINQTAFGILQAARTRMTKTEYISCPSCGRTLFDLQETTAMIRKRTDHLKGVKIGIMGCIVNGPGEMADADYGYVGSGKGKITLYKGQEVVKKSVPSESAVDELILLIKENGHWIEPTI